MGSSLSLAAWLLCHQATLPNLASAQYMLRLWASLLSEAVCSAQLMGEQSLTECPVTLGSSMSEKDLGSKAVCPLCWNKAPSLSSSGRPSPIVQTTLPYTLHHRQEEASVVYNPPVATLPLRPQFPKEFLSPTFLTYARPQWRHLRWPKGSERSGEGMHLCPGHAHGTCA